MKLSTELSIRKGATENLRLVIRELEKVHDHGTVAQLTPILERLVQRRSAAKPKQP
jgi:hypothetical protein